MRNAINLKTVVLTAILVVGLSGMAEAGDPYAEKLKREFYERMDAENRRTANMGMAAWIRDVTGSPLVTKPGVVAAPRAITPIRVAPYVPPPVPASVANSLAITNSKEAREAHDRDLMARAAANIAANRGR